MPSACRRRMPPSKQGAARRSGPTTTSPTCAASCRRLGFAYDWNARAGHLRVRILPLGAVVLHPPVREGSGLQEHGRGQLGPGRPDRAGQRAGHRRPRLALRCAGRAPRDPAVVPADHRLRRRAARRAGPAGRLARAGAHHAAQLDRPLRGGGGRLRAGRGRCARCASITTRPDTICGVTYMAVAAEHPLALAGRQAQSRGAAFIDECRTAAPRRPPWRPPRSAVARWASSAVNPLTGERVPVWVGQFRTDELRHRRGHGGAGARSARLRVRAQVRLADPPGDAPARPRWRQISTSSGALPPRPGARQFRRVRRPEFAQAFDAIAANLEQRGSRARARSTTACATGCVSRQRYWGAPIPVPIVNDEPAARAGARRAACRCCCRKTWRSRAAAHHSRMPEFHRDHVSRVRRARAARNRHLRHLHGVVLVLRPLLPAPDADAAMLDERADYWLPVDSVHRRHRACHPAPAVRALLPQADARRRPGRR